jgi:hypothetical protein
MKYRNASEIDDLLRKLSVEDAAIQENAWHTLVEAGTPALPRVVEAYHTSANRRAKLALLSVISQYRTFQALDFFAGVLASDDDHLWKAALDGLVTLGGKPSRRVLSEAIAASNPIKREWIDEAIAQIDGLNVRGEEL